MLEHHYVQEKLMEYRQAEHHRKHAGVSETTESADRYKSVKSHKNTRWMLAITSSLLRRKKGSILSHKHRLGGLIHRFVVRPAADKTKDRMNASCLCRCLYRRFPFIAPFHRYACPSEP